MAKIDLEQIAKDIQGHLGADFKLADVLQYLDENGYLKDPKVRHAAKARHRWTKEISETAFIVDHQGSKAIVTWPKRDVMIVHKGAIIKGEAPKNSDGSTSYSQKYGEKLRYDHRQDLRGLQTINDIELKSVNEVGLFLYFGGTNGWLVLHDEHGKTLDEFTRVE